MTAPDPAGADELLPRLRAGDTSRGAIEALHVRVEGLCSDYAHRPAPLLLADVDELDQALRHLRPDTGLPGHRGLLTGMGWLAMLTACLRYDTADEAGAHRAADEGAALAQEIRDPRLAAWGAEIGAWIALTRGDLDSAITAAQPGIEQAPTADVAAQLHAQQAKAHARAGRPRAAAAALERALTVLADIPAPQSRSHFAIDPAKATFYAMDIHRLAGNDARAAAAADAVIAASTSPAGAVTAPMRLAEALLTKAVVAARAGSPDTVVALTEQALTIERCSVPSLRMVAAEVTLEVARRDPATAADLRAAVEGQQTAAEPRT